MVESIFQQEIDRMRSLKGYGVQFSILDDNPYRCSLDDSRVAFGEADIYFDSGDSKNNQAVFIDGKEVGFVHEVSYWSIFKPMTVEFLIPLPDEVDEETAANEHFFEDEWNFMRFANLQQMVDYLGVS